MRFWRNPTAILCKILNEKNGFEEEKEKASLKWRFVWPNGCPNLIWTLEKLKCGWISFCTLHVWSRFVYNPSIDLSAKRLHWSYTLVAMVWSKLRVSSQTFFLHLDRPCGTHLFRFWSLVDVKRRYYPTLFIFFICLLLIYC